MIDKLKREECTGCSACVDICPSDAITLETDIEGFWYPVINHDLCTDCGLCEKTCAILYINDLRKTNNKIPVCFGAYHRDPDIRSASTSGGLFSAFASKIFDEGGFVGGAVYNEDFSVKHILTNKREDLSRLRGSKYLQSRTEGFYSLVKTALSIKIILSKGEKVFVCGTPCQMASLRLFLGKEYKNLIICDFICRGINSPKVFRKHLDSLERKSGAKIISAQVKNKKSGWRALTFRTKFANGKVYLEDGLHDNFTRGYMTANCCSRPSCYRCKFKGFPRISDITLGDFWGTERVDKSLDNNTGTSVVLLNSYKGFTFYKSIKSIIDREVKLETILPENIALIKSLPMPSFDRKLFFEDLERFPFEKIVKKYFPLKNLISVKKNIKIITRKYEDRIKPVCRSLKNMPLYPKSILQFLHVNIFRKNTINDFRKGQFFFPTKYTVLDIHKPAHIYINGSMLYGYKRIKNSKLESRLAVEGNGSLIIENGHVSVFYGCDILVSNGANLTFKGNASLNQKVQIICMDSITIGKDVMIGRDVVIRDNDGRHELLAESYKKTASVIIGDHVRIGQGAIIMQGVTIGNGAIINAGAWVSTNVKPNSIVM